MPAPLRIRKPEQMRGADVTPPPGQNLDLYVDRLLKMIPSEVVGMYVVGSGVIPRDAGGILAAWTAVCLVGVIVVRVLATRDKKGQVPPDSIHVAISAIAFLIWVYNLGGPVSALGSHIPYLGPLLILVWTFFVPLFYTGPSRAAGPPPQGM